MPMPVHLSAHRELTPFCMPLRCARTVAYQSTPPKLVRAQSENTVKQQPVPKKIVRRASSGDHAFLPSRTDRDAIKASQKNFGVPQTLVQDSEGSRLPTTRGY